MPKDDAVYLNHIWDAISYIESYTQDATEEEFMTNHLVQDGVIRQLEIIGEAVKSLSDDIIDKYTDVPWHDISAMRNVLIHHYFGVDLDEIWLTIQTDVPDLKENIQKIFDELD
ncbi:DUF86 domain-containing protein [candidate division KSB1 bacterium]|nr:DUF86 domain-containing protein [candidate division KSB1 bacterium]